MVSLTLTSDGGCCRGLLERSIFTVLDLTDSSLNASLSAEGRVKTEGSEAEHLVYSHHLGDIDLNSK